MSYGFSNQNRWPVFSKNKSSGIEWLGEIPAHWKTKRVKRIFNVTNGSTPKTGESEYWDGDITWATPDDLGTLTTREIHQTERYITQAGYESCGTKLVPAGSLLLSTRAPIGYVAIASVNICTNQGCKSLVFRDLDSRLFFYFQLLAAQQELVSFGEGSTYMELAKSKLEYIHVAVPPFEEQRTIADFLDRETGRIDALIAKKERLIELLKEKRTAIITRAVTKGLDPKVSMKETGTVWLGEIPAGWKIMQLKRACDLVRDGTHLPPPRTEGGIPLLSVRNIVDGHFVFLSDDSRISEDDYKELIRSFQVMKNDVLLAIVGATIGKVAIVGEMPPFHIQRSLAVFRPRPGIMDHRYLAYFFKSRNFQQALWSTVAFSAQPGIYLGTLTDFSLVVPSKSEQAIIVQFLEVETEKIDMLINKVHEGVEHLHEYRTSLISAAVTGKIDVREDAA